MRHSGNETDVQYEHLVPIWFPILKLTATKLTILRPLPVRYVYLYSNPTAFEVD